MTDRTFRSRDRSVRAILMAMFLTLMLAACGGGGSGNDDTTTDDPAGTDDATPVEGADELRTVLANEGITTAPTTPEVATALFDLGQALFFDKILSGNQDVSCATCHWPALAGADERTLPRGVGGSGLGDDRVGGAIIPRNSPTTLLAHATSTQFWDGRVQVLDNGTLVTPAGTDLTPAMRAVFDPRWEALAAQAMFPPTSREEMRGALGENDLANIADADLTAIWAGLRDRVVAYTGYQTLLTAAYPTTSLADIEFAHLANAIAAFETRAFAHADSPFARFVEGDSAAMTAEQVAGALEFFGDAGCAQCHSGERFTNDGFHNIGMPQFGPGKGHGAGGDDDFGREGVTGDPDDRYHFRTPTLLNVALTAPYGHVGQYATLEAMVRHYVDPADQRRDYDIFAHVSDPDLSGTLVDNQNDVLSRLDPRVRGRTRFDVNSVVTFLHALTDDGARDLAALIPATVPSGLAVGQ